MDCFPLQVLQVTRYQNQERTGVPAGAARVGAGSDRVGSNPKGLHFSLALIVSKQTRSLSLPVLIPLLQMKLAGLVAAVAATNPAKVL